MGNERIRACLWENWVCLADTYLLRKGHNFEGEDISSNQAAKVVLHLMEGLHGQGHKLYTDNFYTSPQLCSQLLNKGITTCGTVRNDPKDFPKDFFFAKGRRNVPRGEHHYRFNGPVTAVAWFDRRPVYFLTTIHSAPPPGTYTVARRGDNGRTIAVPAPPCTIDYTTYMRGVDRGDQMIDLYNSGRRSKKWWKMLFFHLLECSMLNAYIFHQSHPHQRVDHLQFHQDLASELLSGYSSKKRSFQDQPPNAKCLQPELGHYPVSDTLRDCVCCNVKGSKTGQDRKESRHRSTSSVVFAMSICAFQRSAIVILTITQLNVFDVTEPLLLYTFLIV